jgi:hypothetical protein
MGKIKGLGKMNELHAREMFEALGFEFVPIWGYCFKYVKKGEKLVKPRLYHPDDSWMVKGDITISFHIPNESYSYFQPVIGEKGKGTLDCVHLDIHKAIHQQMLEIERTMVDRLNI